VALGVLGRIDRLDAGTRPATATTPSLRKRAARKPASADANQGRGAIAFWWITAAAIVVVGAIAFVLVAPNGLAWFPVQATTGAPRALVAVPSALPLPSPTETYLLRARSLFASGKLRDALRALDRVPVGDALRTDAERLRADIQRELLAVAGAEASSASSSAVPVSPPRE
jgi:hypothetical protein